MEQLCATSVQAVVEGDWANVVVLQDRTSVRLVLNGIAGPPTNLPKTLFKQHHVVTSSRTLESEHP